MKKGGDNMSHLPNCPQCDSAYTYEDGHLFVCPECAHEWTGEEVEDTTPESVTRDAHGTELHDGGRVTVLKDLKEKGSAIVEKPGTNITEIRTSEGDNDIDCRVPGNGNMQLKSEFSKNI